LSKAYKRVGKHSNAGYQIVCRKHWYDVVRSASTHFDNLKNKKHQNGKYQRKKQIDWATKLFFDVALGKN
jgi:hypothetical protein